MTRNGGHQLIAYSYISFGIEQKYTYKDLFRLAQWKPCLNTLNCKSNNRLSQTNELRQKSDQNVNMNNDVWSYISSYVILHWKSKVVQ